MASPLSSPHLVGREAQIARLVEALDRAKAGRQTTVMGRGEAGAGKSRLMHEFLSVARGRGATTLFGGCVEVSAGYLPFVPVRAALRHLLRDRGDEAMAAQLGTTWSAVHVLLPEVPAAPDPPEDHDLAGSHVFEIVASIITALSRGACVVLAIDDAQWADLSTLQLLRYLTQDDRLPLLVLIFYRGEELPVDADRRKAFEELSRASSGIVEVTPLTREQVLELMTELGQQMTDESRRRVLARSSGMPFLVEELVAAERDGLTRGIPTRFHEVLELRLGALTRPARDVVALVAAAGRPIEHRVISAAAGLPRPQLTAAVSEAQAAHVLVEDAEGQAYTFRHDLVREIVYDGLPAATRADLHSQLAVALEARLPVDPYPTRLCEVVHHWLQSDGNIDDAMWAALRAARASTLACAHPEAARQYEHVLTLWHRAERPEEICGTDLVSVLTEAAEADHWAGRTDAALRHIERALAVAPPDEVDRVAALHERRTLYSWLEGGRLTRGRELLDTITAEATRERMRASELMQSGRYVECVEVARAAVRLAQAAHSASDEIRATIILGVGLAMSGHVAEGVTTIQGALRRAAEDGTAEEVVAGHVNLAFVLLADGQTEEAARVALSGMHEAVQRGAAVADGALLADNAAEAFTRLGRLTEADGVVQEALDRKPPPAVTTMLILARAEIDVLRGRLDESAAALHTIVERGVLDDFQFQGLMRAVEAELQLWDPAAGRPVLLGDLRHGLGSRVADLPIEEDVPLAARLLWLGMRADADAAALARVTGDDERVRLLVDDGAALHDRARALATPYLSDGARRQLDAFVALVAAEQSRLGDDPAPELWQRCAAATTGEPYLHGYSLWRHGAALHAVRRRREAKESLREAYAVAGAAGMQALADAVSAAARSLGLRAEAAVPRPRSQTRPFHLTPKEIQVLDLLVEGYTNRRIASALFMTEKTASVHVSHILAKLSVGSRGEAVARAYEIGLARPGTRQQG
ncbi:MAG: ATP-binding protein [Actinomycetes bacterium]